MKSRSPYEARLFPSARDGKYVRGFIFFHDIDTVMKLYANGRYNASQIYIKGTNTIAQRRSPDLEYEIRSCLSGLITYYNVDISPLEFKPITSKPLFSHTILDSAISFLDLRIIRTEIMRLAELLRIDVRLTGNILECNCPKIASMLLRYIYNNGKPVKLLTS